MKISEEVKVNAEVLGITSAAGTTSLNYDMSHFDRALFVANVQGNFSTVVLDLMESSGATVAGTSAAGSKAGIVVGGPSTLIPVTGGVRQLTITHSSAATAADSFTLSLGTVSKTFTYTTSTASLNSSAWTTALLYFGTTIGSTVNTGIQLSMDALKTAINDSTNGFGNILVCSTPTTDALGVLVGDGATANLGFATTYSGHSAAVNQAVVAYDIKAEDLNSTASKRYLSLKCATASTSNDVAVTVIRAGGRYNPAIFPGVLSS